MANLSFTAEDLQTVRQLFIEAVDSAHAEMLEAIEAWWKYWDDRYDGEPLKDHEIKMLAVLRRAAIGPYRNGKENG